MAAVGAVTEGAVRVDGGGAVALRFFLFFLSLFLIAKQEFCKNVP
jgi:hypothetical protein